MKTITFYSYKGGVGRSLALANIATRLTELSRHVCLLDFDLEAPGLHYKFSNQLKKTEREIRSGLVDYIYQFSNKGILADTLHDFAYTWLGPKAYTTLIPAGNINHPDYWKKLSSINWYEFLYEKDYGLSFLLDLKERIEREYAPDYLLIDSRTGISEMSGITLSLLADEVVIFAANNRENLEGAKRIIKSISNPETMPFNKVPKIFFVLSRIPFTSDPEDRAKQQNLVERIKLEFDNLIDDINIIHSDRELEEAEQIKIAYDYDDMGTQTSVDYLELFYKLIPHEDFSEIEMAEFVKLKESERFYQKALLETDPDLRLKQINKAIQISENRNYDYILLRATIFEEKEKWQEVIDDCNLVLNYDTSNVLAHEKKGNALLKLKQFEEAKYVFDNILFTHQNRITVKLGLARIAQQRREYAIAVSILNDILEKDPLNAVAFKERSDVKIETGQYAAALEDIYKALELNLDFPEAFLTLAKINLNLNNVQEFYLNIEKAFQLFLKDTKGLKLRKHSIVSDDLYEQFKNDTRFLNILKRYSVYTELDAEENNNT